MRTEHQQLTQLQLYRTDEYPCSYLPERLASSQMVAPIDRINDSNYGQLIDLAFPQRSVCVYRPQCPNCRACQSYRIVVNAFAPNRSQRRCWKNGRICMCAWSICTFPKSISPSTAATSSRATPMVPWRTIPKSSTNNFPAQRDHQFLVEFRDARRFAHGQRD